MEYRFSSISASGVYLTSKLYGAALVVGRSLKEGGTYIEYGSHAFLVVRSSLWLASCSTTRIVAKICVEFGPKCKGLIDK